MENVEKYGQTTVFSRRLWPDLENISLVATNRLGSIGLEQYLLLSFGLNGPIVLLILVTYLHRYQLLWGQVYFDVDH